MENKKINDIPIYIIQGSINHNRRNYNLLLKILSYKYEKKFKIKLVGRGNLPRQLFKYRKQIIFRKNLNFIDFHKEFIDAYGIFPLISKTSHP